MTRLTIHYIYLVKDLYGTSTHVQLRLCAPGHLGAQLPPAPHLHPPHQGAAPDI